VHTITAHITYQESRDAVLLYWGRA